MRLRPVVLLPIAALVVLGGAVFLLRDQVDAVSAPSWDNTNPLIAEQAEAVDYRPDHPAPAPPDSLEIDSWDAESLRVRWGSALPGGGDPAAASGYELGWSGGGQTGQLLVASPAAEIRDLDPQTPYAVEVRSVNALGERSAPVRATARPAEAHRETHLAGLAVTHDFDEHTLDGDHWQVTSLECPPRRLPEGGLTGGTPCGRSSLRHRAPFVLQAPDRDGIRGRILLRSGGVSANHWMSNSQTVGLSIALTPPGYGNRGAEFLTAPSDRQADTAGGMPPGSVALILTRDGPRLSVAPGLMTEGNDVEQLDGFSSATGVRSLWELRIEDTRLVMLQDGIEVTSVPVLLPWETADLSLAFSNWNGAEPSLDLIGMSAVDEDVRMDVVSMSDVLGEPVPTPVENSPHLLAAANRVEFVSTHTVEEDGILHLDGEDVELEEIPSTEPGRVWARADLPVDTLRADPAILTAASTEDLPPLTGLLHVWSGPPRQPAEAYPLHQAPPSTPELPTAPAMVRSDGELIDIQSPGASVPRGELEITILIDGRRQEGRTSQVLPAAGFEVLANDGVLLRVPAHEDGPMVGGLHSFTVDVSDHPHDTLILRTWVHGLTAGELEVAPIVQLRLTD
ncbi:fibronectin type III domain-containing protein [Actinoalloteichus fjordicus]|uniref:Fibronectin type-III domain-containing protein n=1 Tax=Actinoalloteichus fjordicus TaxID=1612552 RepID=A0AAC9PPS4_9PSEU|nr:fibronectin type III domain-containing protein [Actinoalloteichus fjordicus]APU12263.1 hypothetical protein UA74_00845 [Actinoalloteichus fjordicus]